MKRGMSVCENFFDSDQLVFDALFDVLLDVKSHTHSADASM